MVDRDELVLSDAEGDELPDEALAELAAVAEVAQGDADGGEVAQGDTDGSETPEEGDTGGDAVEAELAGMRSELEGARAALEAERAAHRAAVARYREALLAADATLPPELVAGDDLDAGAASVEAARRAVAQIRERLARETGEAATRGFPTGAPARGGPNVEAMTPGEKIALGLEQRSG